MLYTKQHNEDPIWVSLLIPAEGQTVVTNNSTDRRTFVY